MPIPAALRDRLAEHLMDVREGRAFTGSRSSYERGRNAGEAAGVEPPGLSRRRCTSAATATRA